LTKKQISTFNSAQPIMRGVIHGTVFTPRTRKQSKSTNLCQAYPDVITFVLLGFTTDGKLPIVIHARLPAKQQDFSLNSNKIKAGYFRRVKES